MQIEDSGLGCDYYTVEIKHPWDDEKTPFSVECGEVAEALEMTVFEANIFKELWRRAAARQGKQKKGNTSLRGAEKMKFFADRILIAEERK